MSGTAIKSLSGIGLVCLMGMVMSSHGIQLRGNNYIGASFDSYHWSDNVLDDSLGRTYGASFFGNYNANTNWDITVGYSGAWDSVKGSDMDITAQTGLLGLNYIIMPEQSVTPYLGGAVGFAYYSAEMGSEKVSDTDPAFAAQVGAEWEMTKSTVLDVAAFGGYVDTETPNNHGEYGVNVSLGISPIEDLVLFTSGSYVCEDEVATFSLGAIIQL